MTWAILRVSPNMERKVAAALGPRTEDNPRGAGLSAYAPTERYRPANHWRTRTRPLIPGYVFVELHTEADLDLVKAPGRRLICCDSVPLAVDPMLIGSLILLEAWNAFDSTWKWTYSRRDKRRGKRGAAPASRWAHGQRVKVTDGPFAGFLAEVARADRCDRLEVLLMLFGRATQVQVDDGWVEAA